MLWATGNPKESQRIFEARRREADEDIKEGIIEERWLLHGFGQARNWRDCFRHTEDVVTLGDIQEDALFDFLRNPSGKSAHHVLVVLGKMARRSKRKVVALSSVQIRIPAPRPPKRIKQSQEGGEFATFQSLWPSLAHTDALHDVIGATNKRPAYENWFWERAPKIGRLQPSRTPQDFTKALCNQWIRSAQLQDIPKPSEKLGRHRIDALPTLPSWTPMVDHVVQSGGKLIVDGLLTDLSLVNECGQRTLNVVGILALLRCMMPAFKAAGLTEIRLMGYTPLYLDNRMPLAFFRAYVQEIQKAVGLVVSIQDVVSAPQPTYAPFRFIYPRVAGAAPHHLPAPTYLQSTTSRKFRIPIHQWAASRLEMFTDKQTFLNRLSLPMTKTTFKCAFDVLHKDTRTHPWLSFLSEANFFRDFFYADLALQHDLAYISQDSLAFTSYTILAHHLELPNRGLFAMQFLQDEWNVMGWNG